MKVALLAILGLFLGALGGAALGIGAGLAWVEIAQTTSFEGYSGMLVFFTFMPLGAAIGGIGGALLFGLLAMRDDAIAIERAPTADRRGARTGKITGFYCKSHISRSLVHCKNVNCVLAEMPYLFVY
jgi:hypothetical protein